MHGIARRRDTNGDVAELDGAEGKRGAGESRKQKIANGK
jgi:hypothetical protein